MGRIFRAARVAQTAEAVLRAEHGRLARPAWLDAVQMIPPSEILVRTNPVQLQPANSRLKTPRRTFIPQKITYEEDDLRRTFYKDHPWELARPRIITEFDGKDARYVDWSKGLRQPGVQLTGEW